MCNTVWLLAVLIPGQVTDPAFDPNPAPPPMETLPASVKKVLDGYLEAIEKKDLDAMATHAAVPWLDRDRQLIRDTDRLKAALKTAVSQLPKGKRLVMPISYKNFRASIPDKADQKLLDNLLGDDGWLVVLSKADDLFSTRFVLIRVQDGKAAIVGGPLKENQVSSQNRIPEIVLQAFEKSETFELYSLNPKRLDDDGKLIEVKDGFHGWRVLGKTEVKAPAQRKRLADALKQGAEDNAGTVAGCFNPRHGIRMKVNGKTIDVVICFECLSVQVLIDDKHTKGFLTTGAPQRAFDAVLKKAGVALPKN